MKKKKIIIVFGIFLLGISFFLKYYLLLDIREGFMKCSNFSQLQTLKAKEITHKIDNAIQIKAENKINGEWAICKSIYNGIEISYNVCPTITFYIDGTGIIETPDKKKTSFTFSRNDSNLIIVFESKIDSERFFNNITVFEYNIEEKGNLDNLILIHEDHHWILSRENNNSKEN